MNAARLISPDARTEKSVRQNYGVKEMISRSSKALLALALVVCVSFLLAMRSEACGPFFNDAIFIVTKHPDFPLEKFAAGKLGVVNPTWARSYLVVAYRTLSNTPLSDGE